MSFLRFASILIFIFLAGVPLYAVPATFSLPPGPRPGIKKLTIQEAAQHLLASGKTGWDLVEAARSMVAERMQYFRRNSFDPAGRAFERGYGYCTQQAYALKHLLNQLGFEARVVQAFQNRFADGKVTAHAWISVRLDGETRQIDSLFYDSQNGELIFTPLSKVRGISPVFKLLAFWGGTAVNAHRFYLSGKDF
jgi:transglutaminase-like putative cysteine protease